MLLTCPSCNKEWVTPHKREVIAKAYCCDSCCDKSRRSREETNKIAELKTPITYADFLKKHPDCLEID
jgi:hydrogenase maturation factor HypF (carbamoyltransferase family)